MCVNDTAYCISITQQAILKFNEVCNERGIRDNLILLAIIFALLHMDCSRYSLSLIQGQNDRNSIYRKIVLRQNVFKIGIRYIGILFSFKH